MQCCDFLSLTGFSLSPPPPAPRTDCWKFKKANVRKTAIKYLLSFFEG